MRRNQDGDAVRLTDAAKQGDDFRNGANVQIGQRLIQ